MSWEVWLEDLLPTKWSGRLAWATIVVAGSAFGLPSILPDSFLPKSPEQIFLLRLVLLLLSTTIGTIAILIVVVKEYNRLKAQPSPKQQIAPQQKERDKEIKRLDDPFEELLELVARFPDKHHNEFAKALKIHPQLALHYLETLQSSNLVSADYALGGPDWHVTAKGRAYLAKFGLLDN
jgi:hypothetical protein